MAPSLQGLQRDFGRACSTSGRIASSIGPAAASAAQQTHRCRRAVRRPRCFSERAPGGTPQFRLCASPIPQSSAAVSSSSTGSRSYSSGGRSDAGVGLAPQRRQQQPQHGRPSAPSTPSTTTTSSTEPLSWDFALLALAATTLGPLAGPACAAEDVIQYNNAAGDGIVKAFSGVLYLGLLGFFFYKTLNRRARQAREEVRGEGEGCCCWGPVVLCCPGGRHCVGACWWLAAGPQESRPALSHTHRSWQARALFARSSLAL